MINFRIRNSEAWKFQNEKISRGENWDSIELLRAKDL